MILCAVPRIPLTTQARTFDVDLSGYLPYSLIICISTGGAAVTTLREKTTKNTRLEFRVPGRQKELIEDAAQLQGVSVSDFLASVAHREAVKVIQESAAIQLSREESTRFVEVLLSPPTPNAVLRKLMQEPARAH